MSKDRILVLGYFGFSNNQIDGQTIKTRNIYELLKAKNLEVDYFDTQIFKENKLAIFSLLNKIFSSNAVFYLPAHNNLKYIFPFLFGLTFVLRKDIYYFVIGGWLREFLKKKPLHRFLLKSINKIFVETNLLKTELCDAGFQNVVVMPNFKIKKLKEHSVEIKKHNLVFISRINKKKGLNVIFKLLDELRSYKDLKVDFYGPVFKEDEDYFLNEIKKFENARYMGCLEPDEVVNTISYYDFMLFPTQYYTEGMPGIIIDASFANLPIVATNWLYASEFIEDEKTGLIAEWNNYDEYVKKVKYLLDTPSRLQYYRKNIRIHSSKYSDVGAWEIINENIFK